MHRQNFLQGIAAGGLSLPTAGAVETPLLQSRDVFGGSASSAKIQLVIDTSRTLGPIDLIRYTLGQRGLSEQPISY
jgi:hypothetical protein